MQAFYTVLVQISAFFLKIAAFFSSKLKLFVNGRKDVFSKLTSHISAQDKTIWFHCASLGEYEQGLPVMKALKKEFPYHKTVLTFFSPSGYEVKKNTAEADIVCYLPLDTKKNAEKFIRITNPDYVFFVKYEFWPNYLLALKKNNIPAFLISGLFRENQIFFKPYGKWMQKTLKSFNYFFVQNEMSKKLLKEIGFENVKVSGDTRFDRVSQQLEQDNTLDFIEKFKKSSLCVVAGSTWVEDEDLLVDYINTATTEIKFIIAPHQISTEDTKKFQKRITKKSIHYSEIKDKNISEYNVLIIDTIGLLTKVYSYAHIAYVGGGMGTAGLHNILEPATFGIPIVIGRNFQKFPEAVALKNRGGLFSVTSKNELKTTLDTLIQHEAEREKTGKICKAFIAENKGATTIIINHIKGLKTQSVFEI